MGLIVRNAQSTIRGCLESFIDNVDQCVVVLAGKSTDTTEKILRKLKTKYGRKLEIYSFDWVDDFSAARNYCFSKLTGDFYCWCDADDEVYQAENLRKLAEEAGPEVGAIWFPYHYALDEFGNVTTLYERERLLRASFGWVWKGRLHETVSPLNDCKFVRSDDVIILHKHLAGASRHERNFKLLNIMLQESPEDKRVWLYLGHQNFAAQYWMNAAEWYLKFGSDPGTIPIERYQALCYCSKAMRQMQDKQAVDVALMAVELYPNYKDAYLELAHSYLMIGDIEKAIHWVKVFELKELIKEPPHIIFINPLDYTFNKSVLLSEAYMKKGDLQNARQYLLEAYKIRPVQDIKKQIEYIGLLERRGRTADSIKVLAVELLNNKEIIKLTHLLESTPFWFRDLDDYQQLKTGIEHYSAQVVDKPDIVEGKDNTALVNLAFVTNPKQFLKEIDNKYKKITLVCPIPTVDSQQINAYSQRDIEDLIMSEEGRHIINLQRESSRIICEYDKNIPQNLAIRIFAGQGLEYWSPKTIKEIGCGGSETSAAWLAKEFALKDCQSIIYAMDTQIWDGVIYRHFASYKPDAIPCHLFISSRQPQVFNDEIPAKQKWLWVHDIHCREFLSPEVAEKIDVIVSLSHWHLEHLKRCYPFLKDAEVIDLDNYKVTYKDDWTAHIFYPEAQVHKLPKMAIIGDAIDTERFAEITEERIPHRFIWCSSPDRGLEEVLNMWGLIKKAFPDAQLKIFYGWEYFNSTLWIPEQRQFKERLRKLIQQDGVEWCGRVGQDQIARELMRADAMLYPPHPFTETYGIAFLEAQAAGVICFYRENGALGETISDKGVPLPMDMKPQDIVTKIVETLNDKIECDNLRQKAREFAMQRTWAKQADKFLSLYDIIN